MQKRLWIGLMLISLFLAACAPTTPASPPAVTESMPEETAGMGEDSLDGQDMQNEAMDDSEHDTAEEVMSEDGMEVDEGQMAGDADQALVDAPAWFSASLTDVRTGETFTIQDLQGKVILVETLAQWCSNCLAQQQEVLKLHETLGEREDFVSLGLDIDPNEDAETLKSYIERNGFTWKYAVSPAEVSREISQLYGNQFLNPPSTPMLIIDRRGQAHPLPFGIKSAADLQAALEPFLQEGM